MKAGIMNAVLILIAAASLSCGLGWHDAAVKGSGQLAQDSRTVESFEKIALSGHATLEVQVGVPQSVVIEADDNIAPLIETEVRDGVLRITRRERFRDVFDHGVTIKIGVPELSGLDVGGACTARITGLSGGDFQIEVSGAGELEASGAVDQLRIAVAGAGQIDCVPLRAKRAEVSVAGAANVRLTATEELVARVSGVGDVRYAGDPARVEPKILGVGRISPL